MDKQEATEFILSRLNENQSQEEIVAELSQQMKAPPDLVSRFVDKVFAENPPEISQQPSQVLPAQDHEIAVAPFLPPDKEQELIPGNQRNIASELQHPDFAEPPTAAEVQEVEEVDTDALKTFIVAELGRHRRHSEVVEEICNRTGWHWNEAQRFVARVQTDNHAVLKKSKNRLLIPIGIVFIIAGCLLVLYTGFGIIELILNPLEMANELSLPINSLPYMIGFLITGVGLILGGVIGLVRVYNSR